MTPIKNCIVNKDTTKNPIWLMRQAGRYLPEFREIRKNNQNFIKLCLNEKLSSSVFLILSIFKSPNFGPKPFSKLTS